MGMTDAHEYVCGVVYRTRSAFHLPSDVSGYLDGGCAGMRIIGISELQKDPADTAGRSTSSGAAETRQTMPV